MRGKKNLGVFWGSGLLLGWLTSQHHPEIKTSLCSLRQGSLDAIVNAIAHIDVKTPRLTKQRFVAGAAAAVAVAGGLVLRIRLRFHNHAPQQLAFGLALHKLAADQLGGDDVGEAGEE